MFECKGGVLSIIIKNYIYQYLIFNPLKTQFMSLHFLTKTTLTLFTCFIFMSATPLPHGERSTKTESRTQIERMVFVVPMYGTDAYQRLVSPAGSLSTGTHECWGVMTYDYLLGKGYSTYVAEWVGGEAMRNYPALDPTVEFAMQQGVSFEDICQALTYCILYCGWE